MPSSGVVMIAFGPRAQVQARLGLRSLLDLCGQPVQSLVRNDTGLDDKRASRVVKVHLLDWSRFGSTLYLDADTRVQGDISAGFGILDAGFDMALSFSDHQGQDAFWHVGEAEREQTLAEIGYLPLQWQCGVMFVRRCERTKKFFDAWAEEWGRWQDEDQAAFVRALHRCPLKLWVLGRPWNGNGLIQHRFGACR